MVPVIALLRPSLVSSLCHSFDLFFREFISSLPVPFPANFCSVDFVSFCSLPIPLPDNICLITCLLISSLPEPFPDNSVLSFVWICLVSIHACPRLRLLPAPPVPQHLDSRFRPTPVHWTSDWITLIATVCQRSILDCCFSLDECFNKEHLFFAPEFCLAIGSSYHILTVSCLCLLLIWAEHSLKSHLHPSVISGSDTVSSRSSFNTRLLNISRFVLICIIIIAPVLCSS